MKAKIILYGWAASWVCLFIGIGTMDYPVAEERNMAVGFALIGVWVIFSLLLIANDRLCSREARRLEQWFDKWID